MAGQPPAVVHHRVWSTGRRSSGPQRGSRHSNDDNWPRGPVRASITISLPGKDVRRRVSMAIGFPSVGRVGVGITSVGAGEGGRGGLCRHSRGRGRSCCVRRCRCVGRETEGEQAVMNRRTVKASFRIFTRQNKAEVPYLKEPPPEDYYPALIQGGEGGQPDIFREGSDHG